MCVVNSKFRYTAEEALKHPWITRKFEDSIPLSYHDYLYEEYLKNSLTDIAKLFIYLSTLPGAEEVISRNVFSHSHLG